jgi:hypothetical protein
VKFLALLAAVVSVVAAVLVASAEAKAAVDPPQDVATVNRADDTLTEGGLRFDGANHPVRWADCGGLGRGFPDPFGNTDREGQAFNAFNCRVGVRFFENGGYNDRSMRVWIRVNDDGSFVPTITFSWYPMKSRYPRASTGSHVLSGSWNKWFSSPSGNIQCSAYKVPKGAPAWGESWVTCQTLQPARTAMVDNDGKTTLCRYSFCVFKRRVSSALPYGSPLRVGKFRCTSSVTGMRCSESTTGHGFTISRRHLARF